MGFGTVPEELRAAIARYDGIHVIVSPPRCSSTAFSRVLWQHPSVGFYSHEPFEVTYYDGALLDEVAAKLGAPLDLGALNGLTDRGSDLVIKEMPYQVGARFAELCSLATGPIVFLMRDPRQNVASRMHKKVEVGDDPNFPSVETGWELLATQIQMCRDVGHPLLLVDSADFRNHPERVFPVVMERLGLTFDRTMLTWQAHVDLDLDNLGGRHTHLYERVLGSTGLDPAFEPIPALDSFPTEGGWRGHVEACLAIYEDLRAAPERVVVEG
jgi:hypothetical protein